jgi:16S rRNA C967 or C1407 C5-methylase (RsmB/RsmF family)
LAIKESRTCDVRRLIQRMDVLPELVVNLQDSSAKRRRSNVLGDVPCSCSET